VADSFLVMSTGTLTRIGALALTAALAAAWSAAPAGAFSLPPKHSGKLSPLLRRLSAPAVSGQGPARQARAVGVAAEGPGSLVREGDRVLVEVGFDHGALARREDLRQAGAEVVGASRPYQVATVAATAADLPGLASVPGVESVTPVRAPMVRAVNCEGGASVSEGVAQMHAGGASGEARAEFGTKGAGVIVGVLSDSYNQANEAVDGSGPIATKAPKDVETGDLTGPANTCSGQGTSVDVLSDPASPESTDEGRAMLQIVHDVAPRAHLAFASAEFGETAFAGSIEELQEAGADVIVDDIGYFEEPFFQEGPVANAVRTVTEDGATYLSAAGNENLFDEEGHEVGSWETPAFTDSGSCPAAVSSSSSLNGHHCLDFDPGSGSDNQFGIKVEAGEVLTIDLQWAESWHGVGTDLDAFLLDGNGNMVAAGVTNNPTTGKPVELLQWENTSSSTKLVNLVVNRFSGGNPRLKFLLMQGSSTTLATEYPVSGGGNVDGPTVFGHAAAADAIAVGAVRYSVDPASPTAAPERFSSRGPATNVFAPVETSGASAKLGSPEVVPKPDVAATDCGQTTFFAHIYTDLGPVWRFCGTSAAAPHAAGVVALMKSKEPLATPADLREALAGTGTRFPEYGSCAIGGGMVEAVGALEAVLGGPTTAPEECEPPDASGPVVRRAGDWDSEPSAPEPEPEPEPSRPQTFIRSHPAHVVRTRGASVRLVFRFGSDQSGVSFLCNVDGAGFRACGKRFARGYRVGSHVLKVKARSAAGLLDSTPAVYRFRVKRVG
jgi:Subtilase family